MSNRKWLWVILIFSVAVRVGVALYFGNVVDAPPLLTDQRSYDALGLRLLAGQGFSFDRFWYPFTPPNTPTAHWSFLHSLFVAGVYALFGANPLAVRLVQAFAGGILLPLMVYRLARQMYPGRAPVHLIAMGLAAGYAYFILYAATLMTETPYIVLLLWSFELSLRLGAKYRLAQPVAGREVALLGLSLGLATLVRQAVLPWVPGLFLWLLWQGWQSGMWRRTLGGLILCGLVLGALILPWTYRNYRVYGQFLLLNSNTGYAMYSAQHPMHGNAFAEFYPAPLPSDLVIGNEAQMDRELMVRGLEFMRADPQRYLRLCLSRVRAYFEFWPTPNESLLHRMGRTLSFGLIWPFMLWGLILTLRDRTSVRRSSLILVFVVFYPLLHILTWAMVRYRLPVDAVSLPFAALALATIYEYGQRWLGARRPTASRPVADPTEQTVRVTCEL